MHDPITYKVFSPHIHIVFLKNTVPKPSCLSSFADKGYQGNVFDMASLQLLAIKPKTWRDLVSDEPFTREDIVTIQVRPLYYCLILADEVERTRRTSLRGI